jgi:hypothetical protein
MEIGEKLIELMKNTSGMKLSNEMRRCEVDSSGRILEYGRDFYGLWNWEVNGRKNEWPGFWSEEDCINDMLEKNKNK